MVAVHWHKNKKRRRRRKTATATTIHIIGSSPTHTHVQQFACLWKFQQFSNEVPLSDDNLCVPRISITKWVGVSAMAWQYDNVKGMIKRFLRWHIINERSSKKTIFTKFINELSSSASNDAPPPPSKNMFCVTYDLINECVNILNAN